MHKAKPAFWESNIGAAIPDGALRSLNWSVSGRRVLSPLIDPETDCNVHVNGMCCTGAAIAYHTNRGFLNSYKAATAGVGQS